LKSSVSSIYIGQYEDILEFVKRDSSGSPTGGSGAEKSREIDLFGHRVDLWVTSRDAWAAQLKA
jgi:hypothetical protein